MRRAATSKSPQKDKRKSRDVSMHSRSSSNKSKNDMDVDQQPTGIKKVGLKHIEEMKSEESEESKCLSVSNISEPLSQLTDSPDEDGPEKQAESKDKNINSESGEEMSSSEQESPRFLHKEIRQKCTEYFRSGLSELDVLKKNITGLTRSTIYRHFQKLRLQGTSQRKFGSGRVKKFTENHGKIILDVLQSDNSLTVNEIANEINKKLENDEWVSATTVWRYIRSQGFISKLPIEKHILTESQKLARKKFWEQNIDRDWSTVLFTDETSFRVGKKKRKCWLMPNISNYTSIRKLSKKVNAWGAISMNGRVNLHLFINNLNKEEYVQILKDNLKEIKEIGGKNFIFQWDNDPKHNSKQALEFYKKNKFDRLEWPPYSPDLNPIENIWGIVKQEVNKYDLLKISDVIAKVKTVWSEIDQEMIKHCIENMPIRLNKWIEASGDWINY